MGIKASGASPQCNDEKKNGWRGVWQRCPSRNCTCPREVSECWSSLLASYYRRYIHQFSYIAQSNTEANWVRVDTWVCWMQFDIQAECQTAFSTLKEKLTQAPILVYPRFDSHPSLCCRQMPVPWAWVLCWIKVVRLWHMLVESRASAWFRESVWPWSMGWVSSLPSRQIIQACHGPLSITVAVITKDGGTPLPVVLGHSGIWLYDSVQEGITWMPMQTLCQGVSDGKTYRLPHKCTLISLRKGRSSAKRPSCESDIRGTTPRQNETRKEWQVVTISLIHS